MHRSLWRTERWRIAVPTTVSRLKQAAPLPERSVADDARLLYARRVRPKVAEMLRAVRLDVCYHHAAGDWLSYQAEGREVRVLDALGGYGSTFFGHNHPELATALIDSVRDGQPFAAQASIRASAARLAERLGARFEHTTGAPAVVTLANSGAESVEAARKHASLAYMSRQREALARVRRTLRQTGDRVECGALTMSDTLQQEWAERFGTSAPPSWSTIEQALLRRASDVLSRPGRFLALNGSFHGKTGGALGLTHGEHHRTPFGAVDDSVRFIDPFAPDAREQLLSVIEGHCQEYTLPMSSEGELRLTSARSCSLSAVFFEPIQGEGGIRELPTSFLRLVRELADEHGFALVADEIQTGMGRTGRFFATEHHGIAADYYVLSKSLGGGLTKIGALLVREDRYVPEFGLLHSSTFAEDEHSSRVALRALDLLEDEGLMEAAQRKGAQILAGLEALCARYPHAFVAARGRGMLLGLELRDLSESQAPLARALSRQGLIGYVAAGFLLHHGRLRVAPSLSSPHTLRIEPSAYFTDADVAHLLTALHALARVLENQDYGALLEFTTLDTRPPDEAPVQTRSYAVRPITFWGEDGDAAARSGRVRRVAFLGHFIHLDDVPLWEPSFERLASANRRILLDRVSPVIAPHPILQRRVQGENGNMIDFTFIGLTHDAVDIESSMRKRALEPLIAEIQQAVDLAEDSGCEVIGLGGYTSIVTRNGKALSTRKAVITTGNSLTAAMTVEALLAAARDSGIALADATLGVLGAGGNIGQLLTRVLAPRVARVVLVGRAGRLAQLHELATELGGDTLVTDDVGELADAELVVGASNSAGEPLAQVQFTDRPRVVCDVAVPPDAPADLERRVPRTRLVMGGLVKVPNAHDFLVPGIPLAPGRIFACMAETMTLGLTPGLRPARLGHLEPDAVERIARAAGRAGLLLAEAKQARSF
jgi:acetylornithine/succinyldiaminopimelate/putrescine aminotransferase/predicted amino acid dehydrogenase